jgi:hypothetical protein
LTGDSWSASQHNTYIKDNFAAGVPDIFTTAGDIVYGTAANTAARLGIGSTSDILSVAAGIPAWQSNGRINALGFDTSTTLTSSTSTSGTDITGLTFNLTTTKTCTVILFMFGSVNASVGDTATQAAMLLGSIGASNQTFNESTPRSYHQAYNPISHVFRVTGVAAATVTCKARIATTDSSRQADCLGGTIFGLAVTE